MEKSRIRDPGWKKVGSGIRDKHLGSATLDKQTCRHVKFERESATGVRQVCNMHVPVYFPPPPIYCTAAVQNSMTTFPFILPSYRFPHEKERDGDRKKECIRYGNRKGGFIAQ
jgi:hypothetical protein